MRTIIYNNIMELVKINTVDAEKTKTGIKYVLRGIRNAEILSLYYNPYKIQLFMGDKLFASAPTFHSVPHDQNHEHAWQLRYIKRMMDDKYELRRMPLLTPYYPNYSVKHRNSYGATPFQTQLLQNAWWKSRITNYKMCAALGNTK